MEFTILGETLYWNVPAVSISGSGYLKSGELFVPDPANYFTNDFTDNDSTYNDNTRYDDSHLMPADTQYISDYDLIGYDKAYISMIRNEIYARYGCEFRNESMDK